MSKLDCKSYLDGDELFRFTKASKRKISTLLNVLINIQS